MKLIATSELLEIALSRLNDKTYDRHKAAWDKLAWAIQVEQLDAEQGRKHG